MLNESNYFYPDNNLKYMGASQFKSFLKCEAAALAEVKGEWYQPCTTAMMVGSYVDAHFSGTMALFRAQHPEIYKRDGSLMAAYEQANAIIQRIESDALMMSYLTGEHQVIMTGKIADVPFKIKVDAYIPGQRIVDQKVMRSMDRVWQDGAYRSFVEAWGYDYQAAIYQKVEGNRLPFILAVATKDDYPDIALLSVPQEVIDDRLEIIESMAPRFQMIKMGLEEPDRCGKCDYCRSTKVLTEVIDYREVRE